MVSVYMVYCDEYLIQNHYFKNIKTTLFPLKTHTHTHTHVHAHKHTHTHTHTHTQTSTTHMKTSLFADHINKQ